MFIDIVRIIINEIKLDEITVTFHPINDRIEKGKLPKAIIVVHLYGMPAKMDEILSIFSKFI